MREITYGWSDYFYFMVIAAENKPGKSNMIDRLMRADGGLTRAMLRALPPAKLKQLYFKLFPESTATIGSAATDNNHSDELSSAITTPNPAARSSNPSLGGIPGTTATIDSKHISHNGVYVNLNKVLDRYFTYTDPVQAEA